MDKEGMEETLRSILKPFSGQETLLQNTEKAKIAESLAKILKLGKRTPALDFLAEPAWVSLLSQTLLRGL